jgi:hypothetical protein
LWFALRAEVSYASVARDQEFNLPAMAAAGVNDNAFSYDRSIHPEEETLAIM